MNGFKSYWKKQKNIQFQHFINAQRHIKQGKKITTEEIEASYKKRGLSKKQKTILLKLMEEKEHANR